LIDMTLFGAKTMLAMGSPQSGQQVPVAMQLVPLLLFGVIAYVLLFRPQQKRQKEHAELLKSVKKGDKVVTTGGVIGVVVSVQDKAVTLRSADTKLEVTKSAIAEITERSGESSES